MPKQHNPSRNTAMKEPVMAATTRKTPKPRFVLLGGKIVHVVHTEAWDRKNSKCIAVRKKVVAGKVPAGSMSPEAALALDGCQHCHTHEVAQALVPVDKEAAKDAARATMDKIAGKDKVASQAKAAKRAKAVAKDKPAKEPKEKRVSMTKSGPRSTASAKDGDPTMLKAKMLADFGTEHGWKTSIGKDDETGHIVVTAKRGDETITAWFIDGKYDINRHAETRLGAWTGKLRGAHACRRQMAGEGRDRIHPEPGKGRGGPKRKDAEVDIPEDESPEDARRRVPFALDDDPASIIDAIKGKVIKWRNGVSGVMEEAWLPSTVRPKKAKRDVMSITEHPKTGERILTFLNVESINESGEHYGQERSVRLNKILKVADS